jgi:hypothetical protein
MENTVTTETTTKPHTDSPMRKVAVLLTVGALALVACDAPATDTGAVVTEAPEEVQEQEPEAETAAGGDIVDRVLRRYPHMTLEDVEKLLEHSYDLDQLLRSQEHIDQMDVQAFRDEWRAQAGDDWINQEMIFEGYVEIGASECAWPKERRYTRLGEALGGVIDAETLRIITRYTCPWRMDEVEEIIEDFERS